MIPFARVPTDLWLQAGVRRAPLDYALLCAFYYSHPAWGLEGFSRCSDLYVTDYLSLTKARVTKLRRQMMVDGIIVYDEGTEEMYLPGFLVSNPITAPTNAVSLNKNLARIKSDAVRAAVLKDVGEEHLALLLSRHEEDQARKRAAAQAKRAKDAGDWGEQTGDFRQIASDRLINSMNSRRQS